MSRKKGGLIVTGGSSGIGAEIIKRVGKQYKHVLNIDVNSEETPTDVRNFRDVVDLIWEALDKYDQTHTGLNDLVICAGVFVPKDFLVQASQEIDFVLDTNTKGALTAIRAFLACHHHYGPFKVNHNIVIISSISAFYHGGTTNVVYDASKAFLSSLPGNLCNYPKCVVNAIQPGTVRQTQIGGWNTDFTTNGPAKDIIDKGQAGDVTKLGMEVTKADIAKIVEFLLFNNNNGAINGTTITVDGGLTVKQNRF